MKTIIITPGSNGERILRYLQDRKKVLEEKLKLKWDAVHKERSKSEVEEHSGAN